MKQNVSETESNWHFRKNVKTSTTWETASDPAFKAWSFSSNFNFACKDGWVATATCKYYFPLVVSPETSISNVAEFLDPSLKTSPCTKTSPVSCENKSSFLLFRNVATFIENHCVLLCYLLQYHDDQPFRRLLPLSCSYGSRQWFFKVKITFVKQ